MFGRAGKGFAWPATLAGLALVVLMLPISAAGQVAPNALPLGVGSQESVTFQQPSASAITLV